ncbi:hypothetical protein B5807_09272 [Epicoccum nigrum]|uniref:BTB domain-containing protein n=1 Tax=Epicoccum nigrum TaxID=105696 RepID=A0A1Y2LPJ7_EPING|nr:hypothetical protein B5807_09272 [Epicoccum nigrum]
MSTLNNDQPTKDGTEPAGTFRLLPPDAALRLLNGSAPPFPSDAARRLFQSPSTSFPSVITLDVVGHRFKVSTDILIAESGLFKHQLSGKYTWTPQVDDSYFLDADPEIFEYILRFLRRPCSYPLFWSKDRGFDYDMYRHLQAEAEYFQVNALYQ